MLRILLASLLLLATPQGVTGQSPSRSDSSKYAAAISQSRAFIQEELRLIGAPGAAVCVGKDDGIIWSEGFGMADVEGQTATTRQTRFRIGSVSKPLTSAAVGLLFQEGRLDLDAPVQRYVPTFPLKRWPITTRELAGHLAGIRQYTEGEFDSQKPYATILDGLSIFAGDSLLHEPGTAFAYSSYGWNLISAVIEGASGESFTTFMKDRIFSPAGMPATEPDFVDSVIPNRARPYVHPDSTPRVINAPYVDNSYKWASGGFVSTADDLCRFGAMLLDGKILRPDVVRLLWKSQKTTNGVPTGYGLGWYTVRAKTGRQIVFHTGDAKGSSALLAIYPENDLVLAILTNSDRSFIEKSGRIADWFLTP